MRRLLQVVLILGVIAYLMTGVVQVRRGERAVVRRFGRVLDEKPTAGLWVGLPWGMDRVDRVDVDTIRSVQVGWADLQATDEDSTSLPPGQMLTGDHNLVNVQLTLKYNVNPEEVVDFVTQQDRVPDLLVRATESALSEWVAARGVDEVLRGKTRMAEAVKAHLKNTVARYRLGVQVQGLEVGRVAPPDEVKSDFDSVARAQTQVETLRNLALQEAATRRAAAEAETQRTARLAEAYQDTAVDAAERDARSFRLRQEQYAARGRSAEYVSLLRREARVELMAKFQQTDGLNVMDHLLGLREIDYLFAPWLPPSR